MLLHSFLFYLFALHFCMKYLTSKEISLSSILYYDYLLCQNKKHQSYCYSIFVLHVYSSSRAKVWALSCLTFPLSVPQYPFIFSFALSPPFFICAPRSQFRRSTLLDGEARQDGRASSEIRFPSRVSLRRSVDIAGLLV